MKYSDLLKDDGPMETWVDIPGYEGLYQVSELGNVKSLAREISVGASGKRDMFIEGRILSPGLCRGYQTVGLCRGGKMEQRKIHRLVAEVFVGGYFEGAIVNHIDGNKQNNDWRNLEWCTHAHNTQHAFKIGTMSNKHKIKVA